MPPRACIVHFPTIIAWGQYLPSTILTGQGALARCVAIGRGKSCVAGDASDGRLLRYAQVCILQHLRSAPAKDASVCRKGRSQYYV